MKPLWQVADLIRAMRRRMRFGELSRAPLQLLRLEVSGDTAECEWMARAADIWDWDQPEPVRHRNVTNQALNDVIEVRKLLFSEMPNIHTATIRVYRQLGVETLELIIAGTVDRTEPGRTSQSLAMRAKLCGLQFHLNDGKLEPL